MHATGMDFRTKDANTHQPKAACWSTLRLKLCKMGGALETKSCETGTQVLQAETTLAEPRAFSQRAGWATLEANRKPIAMTKPQSRSVPHVSAEAGERSLRQPYPGELCLFGVSVPRPPTHTKWEVLAAPTLALRACSTMLQFS